MLADKEQAVLTLYSTLGCHLCDLALDVIKNCPAATEMNLVIVDIADDDVLVSQYGVRIPVVAGMQGKRELGWPFDVDELTYFLTS